MVFFSSGFLKKALWRTSFLARAFGGAVLKAFGGAVSKVSGGAMLRAPVEVAGNEATHCKVEFPAGHSPGSTVEGQDDLDK